MRHFERNAAVGPNLPNHPPDGFFRTHVRWMVIARKVWGGNRTWAGALTQQILVSVLRTCWQQDKDPFPRLLLLQRSPRDAILDIVPGAG